jgi:signal transduction histidine kinase
VVADNLYNNRPITERDKALLQMFAGTAGLAIENAEAFADLKDSITSLRRTRRQLVDQTKLAAVGRLAAHIAHEIRNPLATIGGFAHSMKNRPDDRERVKTGAGIIYEEVMRLEHMLSGIMDFSRPTRPLPARQSLNAVVDRTIEMTREHLPENVALSADTDPGLHEISFDAEQITQVVLNLVRNAGDALGPDGGSIVVATRAAPDGAVLTVADDGPGIPGKIRQKIFEPFYSTKRGGTGLGLAVCRHIAAEHGGQMSVDSEEGRGSTFTLSLPDEPPPPDILDEDEEDAP